MFSSDFGRKRSTADPTEIETIEKGAVFWVFGSLCKDASLKKALQATVALYGQYLSGMSNSLVLILFHLNEKSACHTGVF